MATQINMERGNLATQEIVPLWETKNNKKLIITPIGSRMDFLGCDMYPQDEPTKIIDNKNNHNSYVFQYNRNKKWASIANPYPLSCITTHLCVKDPIIDIGTYHEYTLKEYWERYYKDISNINNIRNKLSEFVGRCTLDEYILLAEKVEKFLKPYLKNNIVLERLFEIEVKDKNGEIRDCKIILKIN